MRLKTHLKHNSHHLLAYPGPHPCPHFQHNTADTPNINLEVVTLLLSVDDFGCHPKNCALHGCESTSSLIVRPLRDTKIGDLADSRHLDKNIIRFEILDEM